MTISSLVTFSFLVKDTFSHNVLFISTDLRPVYSFIERDQIYITRPHTGQDLEDHELTKIYEKLCPAKKN